MKRNYEMCRGQTKNKFSVVNFVYHMYKKKRVIIIFRYFFDSCAQTNEEFEKEQIPLYFIRKKGMC